MCWASPGFHSYSFPAAQIAWSSTSFTSPSSTAGERPTSSPAPSPVEEVGHSYAWLFLSLILMEKILTFQRSWMAEIINLNSPWSILKSSASSELDYDQTNQWALWVKRQSFSHGLFHWLYKDGQSFRFQKGCQCGSARICIQMSGQQGPAINGCKKTQNHWLSIP